MKKLIKKLLKHIIDVFWKIVSFPYLRNLKRGLPNNFTIISNDCCGGVIYHRIGKQFCSPFINLYIEFDDYCRMIQNLDFYLSSDLIQIDSEFNYPVGLLGGGDDLVKIHFMHDESFSTAIEQWERRKKRIIKEKMFYVFNLTNDLDEELVIERINKIKALNLTNFIIMSRFDFDDSRCIKIDFSDLKTFHNAQILQPQRCRYKLHIDQINYKKTFACFND